MKRIFSMLTVVCVLLTMCVSASAQEMEADITEGILETSYTTEFETVLQASKDWQDRIADEGDITIDPMETYRQAFTERCAESEETLRDFGYSDDEISVMKAYLAGEETFEYAATRATSGVTGTLSCSKHTPAQYQLRYSFVWDKFPVNVADAAITLGANGYTGNMICEAILDRYSYNIAYVNSSGQATTASVKPTLKPNGAGLAANFPQITTSSDKSQNVWVRSGYLDMSVSPMDTSAGTFTKVRGYGSYIYPTAQGVSFTATLNVALKAPFLALLLALAVVLIRYRKSRFIESSGIMREQRQRNSRKR